LYSDFIHFSTRPPAPKSTIIELSKSQKEEIQSSKRISNPGCYPTGFIALIRPLVAAGIIPPDAPLTVNAISGYSGGGKGLIEIYESDEHEPWGSYGYSMVSSNEQGFCPWIHLLPIVI
jgi:N-acetyl-gamma-glutamyl-phosphate reductase